MVQYGNLEPAGATLFADSTSDPGRGGWRVTSRPESFKCRHQVAEGLRSAFDSVLILFCENFYGFINIPVLSGISTIELWYENTRIIHHPYIVNPIHRKAG